MAVDSLELRPRGTVALLDAAVRLCGRALGVWSIVLPAGAALTWALFHFVETARLHRPMVWPAAALAGAWLLRAVAQGAASHHLEVTVLGAGEPDAWRSWLKALGRLPSLLIVCAHNLVLNVTLFTFTAGLGLLFLSAHSAGYAVALRGEGHPLATYFTCSRLLGPARHSAGWVRVAGLAQLVIAFNLHVGANLLFKACETLLALDVSFAERFASLDNPVWAAVLGSLAFTVFEPLRAACATLLLVDGRVRQEGLDLAAAVEQLPTRRRQKPSVAAGAAVLVLLAAGVARAQPADDWTGVYFPSGPKQEAPVNPSSLAERLAAVASGCAGEDASPAVPGLEAVAALPASEQAALSRFVARVERTAFDEEDCEAALADLKKGVALAAASGQAGDADAARDEARRILERPEFAVAAPVVKPDAAPEAPPEPPGWLQKLWDDFWEALIKWLRGSNRREPVNVSPPAPGIDLGLTNVVVVAAIALAVGVLLALLIRARSARKKVSAGADVASIAENPLTTDPMSALAKPPEGWAELADALAKQGQFRDAIRHLYLALLSRLHRDGAIDYDPAKSNWDYFRGFRGPREALPPFKELTLRFDFAWYGNLDVSPQAYTAFRGLTHPLLAAKEPADA